MQTTANRAIQRALGPRRAPQGRRAHGSLLLGSTLSVGLVLAGAVPASAQDLTGTYLYHPPEGTVTLELRQAGNRLTGVLYGLDGTANPLEGALEAGRATGTIRMTSGDGWFAVAAHADGVRLLAGAFDPDTGEPDLTDGWQLDFTRAQAIGTGAASTAGSVAPHGAASAAGSAAPHGAAPAAGSAAPRGAASSTPTVTPLVQEWMTHLGGRKVTYMESYGDGSGGFSDRWEAYICSDGSFHFRSRSSVNVDVGGVFGNSSGSDSFSGRWRIIEHNGQAVLQYQQEHEVGTDQGQWVALGYQNGATYFDGARVYVTDDNAMCR